MNVQASYQTRAAVNAHWLAMAVLADEGASIMPRLGDIPEVANYGVLLSQGVAGLLKEEVRK